MSGEDTFAEAVREHQPRHWYTPHTWPSCSCGFDPRDNEALTAHWREFGIEWIGVSGHTEAHPVPTGGADDARALLEQFEVRWSEAAAGPEQIEAAKSAVDQSIAAPGHYAGLGHAARIARGGVA